MGLYIKKKNDLYAVFSSVTDKRIHDKQWLTLDEAKKEVIMHGFYKFLYDAIEVYMDFPSGYEVNGARRHSRDNEFHSWFMDVGKYVEGVESKTKEMIDKLSLDFKI
jgi:hypothetical protein